MTINSLSLLNEAFFETGTQLDRIVEAYQRKDPNYPRVLAFARKAVNLPFEETAEIRIYSPNECEVISSIVGAEYSLTNGVLDWSIGQSLGHISFDTDTFEISYDSTYFSSAAWV